MNKPSQSARIKEIMDELLLMRAEYEAKQAELRSQLHEMFDCGPGKSPRQIVHDMFDMFLFPES